MTSDQKGLGLICHQPSPNCSSVRRPRDSKRLNSKVRVVTATTSHGQFGSRALGVAMATSIAIQKGSIRFRWAISMPVVTERPPNCTKLGTRLQAKYTWRGKPREKCPGDVKPTTMSLGPVEPLAQAGGRGSCPFLCINWRDFFARVCVHGFVFPRRGLQNAWPPDVRQARLFLLRAARPLYEYEIDATHQPGRRRRLAPISITTVDGRNPAPL